MLSTPGWVSGQAENARALAQRRRPPMERRRQRRPESQRFQGGGRDFRGSALYRARLLRHWLTRSLQISSPPAQVEGAWRSRCAAQDRRQQSAPRREMEVAGSGGDGNDTMIPILQQPRLESARHREVGVRVSAERARRRRLGRRRCHAGQVPPSRFRAPGGWRQSGRRPGGGAPLACSERRGPGLPAFRNGQGTNLGSEFRLGRLRLTGTT
jgi:hypothetical protein